MAANKSENKVRVTKVLGGGGAIGMMDPLVNMSTHLGTIIALDSGNFQVEVSGAGVGLTSKAYPHQLFVEYSHATGVWSWPTGDGSVEFTRTGTFPTGFTTMVGSGMFYHPGVGNPVVFSR